MNHREKLLDIYNKVSLQKSFEQKKIPVEYSNYISIIANKSFNQKGVFTVLTTLLVHKSLYPKQDIRFHQEKMKGGFSGRTIDTKYITPTLKELKLPSMAASGWLTRSLEQPYPYMLDYKGHIKDLEAKEAFLKIIDYIQKNPKDSEIILLLLLNRIVELMKSQKVGIIKLENPDEFQIYNIVEMLTEQFLFNYKTANGSKLPVIAFYSIYQSLIQEIKRYEGCSLKKLGYHTTCDTTSKSAGDIEILNVDNSTIEVLEIKFEKEIDINILRIAYEKICKHNPKRYYILSTKNIKQEDEEEIRKMINFICIEHGCQVIINGVIPSLKYYLRLISSLDKFLIDYSENISIDEELKQIHKEKWNEILKKHCIKNLLKT